VNRSVRVPKPISVRIGQFGLSRTMFVRLGAAIHSDIKHDYERFRKFRAKDNRCYKYRIALAEAGERHLFLLKIDDSTSPDDLIIMSIRHYVKP
jgi:hypothetical protein